MNKINKGTFMVALVLVLIIISLFSKEEKSYDYSNSVEKIKDTKEIKEELTTKKIIEVEIPKINQRIPDLDRDVYFTNAPDSSRLKILEISKDLKTDTGNVSLWLQLGLLRKAINDYEGSVEAWEYIKVISPQYSLVYRNLGDLYAYHIKDLKKSEENFLESINKDPSQIEYYFATARFYREIIKDTAKAKNIVRNGIISNPNSTDLKALLGSL